MAALACVCDEGTVWPWAQPDATPPVRTTSSASDVMVTYLFTQDVAFLETARDVPVCGFDVLKVRLQCRIIDASLGLTYSSFPRSV